MSNSITATVVGEIIKNENQINVQINCDPVNVDLAASSSFINANAEVKIPYNVHNVFPLSGGAIIKIDVNNSNYNFKKADTKTYDGRVAKIKEIINNELKSISALSPEVIFNNYNLLADLRIGLNKTFYKIANFLRSGQNFYETDGVPEFILSAVYSPNTATQLQNTYNNNINSNIRDENLSPFLNLQFIPFESILEIFSILAATSTATDSLGGSSKERGPGTFYGNTKIKFSDLYSKLKELSEKPENFSNIERENILSLATLELFPIYRIGEEVIIAEIDDKLQLGGFYTFFDSKFYIKMPDLSGRDSTEYYSNFTTKGDTEKSSLFYVLEILSKAELAYEYKPIVLVYNQLPSLTLKDGEMSYPETSNYQADNQFIYTGLDSIYLTESKNELNKFNSINLKYFLSPLIKSNVSNNNIIKSGDKSLSGIEINSSQPIEIATIPRDTTILYLSSSINDLSKRVDYLEKYRTIPLFENLNIFGVTSLDAILAVINRPEIAITDRIDNKTIDNKEVLFYSTEQQYTRYAISGSLPRYLFSIPQKPDPNNSDLSIVDFSKNITIPDNLSIQVPRHWIELNSSFSNQDTKDIILTLSNAGLSNLRQYFKTTAEPNPDSTTQYFDLSDPDNQICFATYVIDDVTGQFFRLPGPNLNISLAEAVIKSIKPNGYLGGEPIKTNDSISIEIIGENLSDAKAAYLILGTENKLIASSSDAGFNASSSSVVINIPKKWSDITTGIGEFGVFLTVENTKNKETNKDIKINISEDFIISTQLTRKDADKVKFSSINSIYYQPRGRPANLDRYSVNTSGPDSIPVLFNENNIKIKVGSDTNIFIDQNKNIIFSYLVFKDEDGISARELVETFGLKEDVISITVDNVVYYTNRKMVWSFGDPDFVKGDSLNSAEIYFPGPINSKPFNIRSIIEGSLKPKRAYLLFANQVFTSNQRVAIFDADRSFPVSILQIGTTEIDRPAFINPPHILGILAKSNKDKNGVSNFDLSDVIAASKQGKGSLNYKIKKAIPSRMFSESSLKNIVNGKISVQNSIDHLFILFNAPRKDKKYFKDCYSFYLGSQDITSNLSGKVKYLSNNIACAYFRKISTVGLGGFSDLSISVKDYEFSSEYNSDLYTKVSKVLSQNEYEIVELTGSDSTVGNFKSVILKNNSARRILTYGARSDSIAQNSTSLIVPINNSAESFRYQKYGFISNPLSVKPYNKSGAILNSISGGNTNLDLYIRFASPIKINPINLDITFGNLDAISTTTDSKAVFGAVLSDEKIKDGSVKEDVVILKSDTLEIIDSITDAKNSGNSVLQESITKSDNIRARNAKTIAFTASSKEEIELANASNDAIFSLDSALPDLQSLLSSATATAAEINALVEKVNYLMKQAAALNDRLSSANYSLLGIVDELGLTGPDGRPTSIISLNQVYCYLPSNFVYNSSFMDESVPSSSNKELFVVVSTKISQAHTIEARIPQIVSITTKFDGKEYISSEFSNLKLGSSGTELTIKTTGGDEDSKFEVSGYRISTEFVRSEGELQIYTAFIEPAPYVVTFLGSDCIKLSVSNSNKDRLKAERVLDPTAGQDIEKFFDKAKGTIDKQSKKVLDESIEKKGKIKLGPVLFDKSLAAPEAFKSFCDLSFHLTAEVSSQLKFFKILYVPIKVIFCIIDVICALLNPVKLAFAVVRLFACLFDLILLLPQISMPVLFLTIALHILELLLCLVQKVLGIVVAINEIITALDVAVRRKNIESIKNLELTLNEHFLTLELDFQVIEPILQMLGLILELLQLNFSFPCQITQDEDEPACIDPSMLAGLIVGKVAPNGKIVPDAMIPLAQDYTSLSVDRTGENGNTPDSADGELKIIDIDYNNPPEDPSGSPLTNVLYKVSEAVDSGTYNIVSDNTGFAGNPLPDLIDSQTNEKRLVQNGGYFSGDQNGDGLIDNINYGKLRFSGSEFEASFGLSCTKTKKRFSFGTTNLNEKNDPRFVEFQFKSSGLTSDYAWTIIGAFFKKKIIDDLFPLDSSPALLKKNGNSLEIHADSVINGEDISLVSPIDGFSSFIEYAGVGQGGKYTYRARSLVAEIEVFETDIDPKTNEPITTSRTVIKTFGGIPSFAIVDEKFNVYFIEENGLTIRIEEINGVKFPVIDNIFAKMINLPSATTQKFDREERQAIRRTAAYNKKGGLFKSKVVDDLLVYCAQSGDINLNIWNQGYQNDLGDAILKMQANAGFLEGISAQDLLDIYAESSPSWLDYSTDTAIFGSSKPIAVVGPTGGPYTVYINYNKLNDQLLREDGAAITDSTGYIGKDGASRLKAYLESLLPSGSPTTFNFPYPEYGVYDFANGSWAENDDFQYAVNTIDVYNFPQIYFVDLRQVADDIAAACGTSQTNELLLDMPGFNADFGKDVVEPYLDCLTSFKDFFTGDGSGIISKARASLAEGRIPGAVSIADVRAAYDAILECTNKAVDDSCKFVINPLNTTFKLIEDKDETDLSDYIDPASVITEVITDGAVTTMPTITGAMEYASGIGDLVTVRAGGFATIQIIPRDSYDDEIISSFDARERISVSIVSDTTATGARLQKVNPDQELLWSKNDSIYTAKITSETPGKVTIKASICNVVIQAVTDRGISTEVIDPETKADCIPDADAGLATADLFPPGALVKVDRILTILFTANERVNKISESGNGNAVLSPQVVFTDMVN